MRRSTGFRMPVGFGHADFVSPPSTPGRSVDRMQLFSGGFIIYLTCHEGCFLLSDSICTRGITIREPSNGVGVRALPYSYTLISAAAAGLSQPDG